MRLKLCRSLLDWMCYWRTLMAFKHIAISSRLSSSANVHRPLGKHHASDSWQRKQSTLDGSPSVTSTCIRRHCTQSIVALYSIGDPHSTQATCGIVCTGIAAGSEAAVDSPDPLPSIVVRPSRLPLESPAAASIFTLGIV